MMPTHRFLKLIVLAIVFGRSFAAAAAPNTRSVEWLQLNLTEVVGKREKVVIAYVEADRVKRGYNVFIAPTVTADGRYGNPIAILVAPIAAEAFRDHYGTKPRTNGSQISGLPFTAFVFSLGGLPALCTDPAPAPAEDGSGVGVGLRIWTRTDGRKILAQFASATTNTAKIWRLPDGEEFDFPLVQLSTADREFVTAQAR